MPEPWGTILDHITTVSGQLGTDYQRHAVGGGSINQSWQLQSEERSWFVKLNSASREDMFIAEAEGLQALAEANAIRIPSPLCWGVAGGQSYLVMEFIPLNGSPSPMHFAEALAHVHKHTSGLYGWHRDNTIGSTPQPNRQCDHWATFWREERLESQLALAQENGASTQLIDKGKRLAGSCDSLLSGRRPLASVLHGDLWSGNWGADENGRPVIFDPAVYFGDHETDLAMMTLFGSPGRRFFDHYQEHFPIDPGFFEVRKTFYNLYHILNHFNLFGGGYAHQAEAMIDELLASIKA